MITADLISAAVVSIEHELRDMYMSYAVCIEELTLYFIYFNESNSNLFWLFRFRLLVHNAKYLHYFCQLKYNYLHNLHTINDLNF
jgi:hypothetical protein